MATTRKPWTRDELLILCNLYEKIPFGQLHSKNKTLITVAKAMDRTPGSVTMKLGNLASLDERLQARGIKGLSGASELDRTVWAEYHGEKEEFLAIESEDLLKRLLGWSSRYTLDVTSSDGITTDVPTGPTEREAWTKLRRGQWYFRQVVLNAYGGRCALTGLSVRELLVASHIVPWSGPHGTDCPTDTVFDIQPPPLVLKHRLDVRNGIALNALHDKAFDDGFITFDKKLCMVLSPHLKHMMKAEVVARHFKPYLKKPLTFPAESAGPDPKYLEWHREWAFRSSSVF